MKDNGAIGGKALGGKARATQLSPERRAEIARAGAEARGTGHSEPRRTKHQQLEERVANLEKSVMQLQAALIDANTRLFQLMYGR